MFPKRPFTQEDLDEAVRPPWCCICGKLVAVGDIQDPLFPYHVEQCRHQGCEAEFQKMWAADGPINEEQYEEVGRKAGTVPPKTEEEIRVLNILRQAFP